jgi:hypothetical protein
MPKVTYTPSKGLVQAAGSGVDLTVVGGGVVWRKNVKDGSGGNVTLTAADSGSVVFVSGGARTVNLPTVAAAGAGFEVQVYAASAHAHVLQSGTDDVLQGCNIDGGTGSTVAYAPITAQDKVTLANPRIGDRIDVWCDGTNFHVTAITSDTAALATA